jgi:hypothetical protein
MFSYDVTCFSYGGQRLLQGATLKKVARRQTRAQQRKEEVKKKKTSPTDVPVDTGKQREGPVTLDSAPNWLLNAKPLTAEVDLLYLFPLALLPPNRQCFLPYR